MAASQRRRTAYATSGSVAYQPEFDGNAVRSPRRRQTEAPVRRPQVQPRERVQARPKVEVREQGAVSLFAVIGFLAVGLCAALMLVTCAQLAVVTDQTVSLKSQYTALKKEESSLLAQYELAYDLSSIEQQLTSDGTMVQPRSNQIFYIDLSEEDSVVRYDQPESGINSLWSDARNFISGLVS